MNPQRIVLLLLLCISLSSWAEDILWIEGEKPTKADVTRFPQWYDMVKRDQLSGRDFISHWNEKKAGTVEYQFTVAKAGTYEFWVRANPVQSKLSYQLNGGEFKAIEFEKNVIDNTNIAADDKPDLRFVAWIKVGKLELKKGNQTLVFKMESANHHHGIIDCFVLSAQPFTPKGILKPGETAPVAEEDRGWIPFNPTNDPFKASPIDLRDLNEKVAGMSGPIRTKGSEFIRGDGEPIRFWAVNGPASRSREDLAYEARLLAKYGVNLVRIHHGYYNEQGELDPAKIQEAIEVVETLKNHGIYSHFSIYFPLWLKPNAKTPWAQGYDGKKHPFASLFFNKSFQQEYRNWWKALLTTPHAKTGKKLIDEPAVMGLEILNEDSYLFWTFSDDNIPDAQLKILEAQFGEWLKRKYGSIDKALTTWGGGKLKRDQPAEGRIAFRPLWNMANERTTRDKDTVAFLIESQRRFYDETKSFLRELGFKGVITASNWTTADARVFGPLEKYSYTGTDFVDRHGYFSCFHKGENAEWSIRNGHTYRDRSAFKFEAEESGKPRVFAHPVMDPSYNNLPSMISETTFTRPNRYRSEAPIYYAAYGALQGSDAIVHFAFDGARWSVKPGYFMQPWTLCSPAMLGQFPATALLYRKGLVQTGETVVNLNLKLNDLLNLQGTPLPQDALLDELRLKDVKGTSTLKPGELIDPLVHYVGRTNVNITQEGGASTLSDLSKFIDRKKMMVTSSTNELKLDYGQGILQINSPKAQGLCGALKLAGRTELQDIEVSSALELGHILVVSLDGKPLAQSGQMLLQVMTEERPSRFQTDKGPNGIQKIVNIGTDPWLFKPIEGTVRFKRADAAQLRITPLDHYGYPLVKEASLGAGEIKLKPSAVYYLISRD